MAHRAKTGPGAHAHVHRYVPAVQWQRENLGLFGARRLRATPPAWLYDGVWSRSSSARNSAEWVFEDDVGPFRREGEGYDPSDEGYRIASER